MTGPEELKDWVRSNLTSESVGQLDKWKDDVAQLLTLSKSGDVVPKVDPSKLDAKDAILLQAIGKAYAEVAGYVDAATVSAPSLANAIGTPTGTIGWALSELRNEHLLVQEKRGVYRIQIGHFGEAVLRLKTAASIGGK